MMSNPWVVITLITAVQTIVIELLRRRDPVRQQYFKTIPPLPLSVRTEDITNGPPKSDRSHVVL